MLIKTKQTIKKIKEYLARELAIEDVLIFHRKNAFDMMYNSNCSASWGWITPLKHNGYRIVWLRYSPEKKEDKQIVMFDFITEKKFNKKYD